MPDVASAVRAELAALGLDPADSGLAATAIALALAMDDAESARDTASLGRELRAVLADIHRATPERQEEDGLDELNARRAARRGA
jgi:hypothetical protein